MSLRRKSRQRGQSIVVIALAMTALLSVLALVVNAGYAWTTRRHLQELSDAAALSGATYVGLKACGYAPSLLTLSDAQTAFGKAQEVLDAQLGTGVAQPVSGGCPSAWHYHLDYPNNVSVDMNFPYRSDPYELEVIVQQTVSLTLTNFLTGAPSTPIVGRAVAKHLFGTPESTYAVYAEQQVSCQGNVPANVSGSVYATQGYGFNGNCYIYAHALPGQSSVNYLDFGNIVTPLNGQSLGNASTGCSASLCADGYEWLGSTAPSTCGVSGPGGSQYLDPGQYNGGNPTVNPNPCSQNRTVQPQPYPAFNDPNAWLTSQGMAHCDPNTNYGTGPGTNGTDAAGYLHYKPGCYSDLTVTGKTAFDPGFYYFNGKNSGQGLILPGGSQSLARDVTFEFVNGTGFNTSNCGSACSWGSDPAGANPDPAVYPTSGDYYFSAPPGDNTSAWCTSSNGCPLKGLLVYEGPTNGFTAGAFSMSGPHFTGWFRGSVSWQYGNCTWWANATSQILGQFACNNIALQGGAVSIGGAVDYSAGAINVASTESALVE